LRRLRLSTRGMKMLLATFTNADDGLQARIETSGKLLKVSLVDLDVEKWEGTQVATVGSKFFTKEKKDKAYFTAESWSNSNID
jgi:hypothetical protein